MAVTCVLIGENRLRLWGIVYPETRVGHYSMVKGERKGKELGKTPYELHIMENFKPVQN